MEKFIYQISCFFIELKNQECELAKGLRRTPTDQKRDFKTFSYTSMDSWFMTGGIFSISGMSQLAIHMIKDETEAFIPSTQIHYK